MGFWPVSVLQYVGILAVLRVIFRFNWLGQIFVMMFVGIEIKNHFLYSVSIFYT